MLKRGTRYGIIAVTLALAILLQPMWPAIILAGLTASLSGFTIAQRGLPSFGLDLPSQRVQAEPKLDLLSRPEFIGASPALAQGTTGCAKIYLPLILKGSSGSAASSTESSGTSVSAEALIPGPEFVINSPKEGWTISGMLFFAAQPLNSTGVASVTFKAGSTTLGVDSTQADGFKVFLNAKTFPAGPLQLTATASGPCGQLTKTITVNNVPNPPSNGTIGSQGGVLASQIGSIITFPPGAVPNGTTMTVTEKTQQEITAENGFDWDAMGVTFLGAQVITSSAPISPPLGVASAGFGPRVQPGQVVVNYNLLPDANGDGVDELVVVNTASVAPNNDVISDPVPQVGLISGEIQSTGRNLHSLQNGVSGPPGTFFEINATGFNPFSALGNVAIYRSSVDGTEFRMPVAIIDGFGVGDTQTLLTMIPSLPPGPATLELRNESTGSTIGPFDITVEVPTPLTRPAAEIIDEFLVSTSDNLDVFANELAGEPAFSQAIEFIDSAKNRIPELRALIQEMGNDPELDELLVNMAVVIENANVSAPLSALRSGQVSTGGPNCENKDEYLGSPWWEDFIVKGLPWPEFVSEVLSRGFDVGHAAAQQFATAAFAFHALMWVAKLAALTTIMIDCFQNRPRPPQSIDSSPLFFEGMGAVLPSGGSGAGNAPTPPLTGTVSSLSTQAVSFLDQQLGRVIVKVASIGGAGFPFSGATDAGGYFFIPLIPQGEPFIATAIDTLTGQIRTFEGVGPPVGESVFMSFDFFSGDTGGITELQFGEVISASIASPTEIDTYSFQGTAGDGIFLRMKGLWTIGDPGCCHYPAYEVYRPNGTLLCSNPPFGVNLREETCALDATGTYTLLYSDYASGNTGSYQLYLQRTNPPALATVIDFGQTVTGPLEFLVKLGAHTFNGTTGDRILFRMSAASPSQPLQPQFWVFRPDGTPLCDALSTDSLADVEETCILDAGGIHSILAGGWAAQSLNPYALYLQRLNNPSQVTPTSFGEVKSGTLDMLAKADTYRFDGTSGDQVVVRMRHTATLPSSPYDFWPMFRLYRQDGTELCSKFFNRLAEATCLLDVTGPYTILASNRQGIGAYNLFIQGTNNPANATPIAYGNTLSGTLAVAAEMDAYTFSGTAGDQILVRITEIATVLEPEVRVYRPNNTLLCSTFNNAIAEVQCTLDINGTYTILAGDNAGEDTGNYDIFLNRTN